MSVTDCVHRPSDSEPHCEWSKGGANISPSLGGHFAAMCGGKRRFFVFFYNKKPECNGTYTRLPIYWLEPFEWLMERQRAEATQKRKPQPLATGRRAKIMAMVGCVVAERNDSLASGE